MIATARRFVKGREKASEDEASSDGTDGWIKASDESSSDEASSSEVESSSDEVSNGSEYVDDGSDVDDDDDADDDDDDDDDDDRMSVEAEGTRRGDGKHRPPSMQELTTALDQRVEVMGTGRGDGKDGDGAQCVAEAPATAPVATAPAPKAATASGDDVDDIFTEEAFAAPTVARKRLMKKGC